MAYRHVETTVEAFTHALATEFNDYPALGVERDILPKRQEFLRSVILGGTAVPFSIARVLIKDEGDAEAAPKKKGNGRGGKKNGNGGNGAIYHRINGQHSSNLLATWPDNPENGGYPADLVAVKSTFEADTIKDAAAAFRAFDSRHSARSILDVFGAFQNSFEGLKGLPRDVAKLGLEGAIWFRTNITGLPAPDKDSAMELFEDKSLHPFLHWICGFAFNKAKEMKRISVAAAMFGTFEQSREDAEIFWKDTASDGGTNRMDDTHPTTKLDAWLKSSLNPQQRANRIVRVSPASLYQGSVYAWNAYRGGKPVKGIYSDTAKGMLDIE